MEEKTQIAYDYSPPFCFKGEFKSIAGEVAPSLLASLSAVINGPSSPEERSPALRLHCKLPA